MNSRERMRCALAGGVPDRVPFGEVDVDQVVARKIVSGLEITQLLGRDVPSDLCRRRTQRGMTGTCVVVDGGFAAM